MRVSKVSLIAYLKHKLHDALSVCETFESLSKIDGKQIKSYELLISTQNLRIQELLDIAEHFNIDLQGE